MINTSSKRQQNRQRRKASNNLLTVAVLRKQMSITRDIEKESLEAHVELCAARYSRLEEKLDNLEGRVIGIETVLGEIRTTQINDRDNRNKQLIGWGVGAISTLVATCGFLLYRLIVS